MTKRLIGSFLEGLKVRGRRPLRRKYASTTLSSNKHEAMMREKLRKSGAALGSQGPIKIRAEKVSPTEKDKKLYIGESCKIVHFQRHGQGYHNLLYLVLKDNGVELEDIYKNDPVKNPFVRPEIVDSPLTEHGRTQCMEQRKSYASKLNPELIIVSPMHRALQTAQITFRDFGSVPFVAHELCREELGLLTCNRRRPLSDTKKEFPDIDFSLLDQIDEDKLWNPDERECPSDKSKRIYDFLVHFVLERPEQEIAIVGHSAWLFNMTNAVVDCGDDVELSSWFGTAEIRSMKLTWDKDKDRGST